MNFFKLIYLLPVLLVSCATGSSSSQDELSSQGMRWQSEDAFNKAAVAGDAKAVALFLKANGGLWGELARVQRTYVDPSSILKSQVKLRGVLNTAVAAVENDRVEVIATLAPYLSAEELRLAMMEAAYQCKSTSAMLDKFYALGQSLPDSYPGFHLKQGKGNAGPISCPEQLKLVLEKQPKLLPNLLNTTIKQLEGYLKTGLVSEYYNANSTRYLEEKSTLVCGSSSSDQCRTYPLFIGMLKTSKEKFAADQGSEQKRKAEQQKQTEHQSSPEGLKSSICQLQRDVVMYEQQIRQEQQIGQMSGVVNAAKLHEHAELVLNLKGQQVPFMNRYSQKTGKAFNLKSCATH